MCDEAVNVAEAIEDILGKSVHDNVLSSGLHIDDAAVWVGPSGRMFRQNQTRRSRIPWLSPRRLGKTPSVYIVSCISERQQLT